MALSGAVEMIRAMMAAVAAAIFLDLAIDNVDLEVTRLTSMSKVGIFLETTKPDTN